MAEVGWLRLVCVSSLNIECLTPPAIALWGNFNGFWLGYALFGKIRFELSQRRLCEGIQGNRFTVWSLECSYDVLTACSCFFQAFLVLIIHCSRIWNSQSTRSRFLRSYRFVLANQSINQSMENVANQSMENVTNQSISPLVNQLVETCCVIPFRCDTFSSSRKRLVYIFRCARFQFFRKSIPTWRRLAYVSRSKGFFSTHAKKTTTVDSWCACMIKTERELNLKLLAEKQLQALLPIGKSNADDREKTRLSGWTIWTNQCAAECTAHRMLHFRPSCVIKTVGMYF